jgi:dUTP pyrophosphatase
MEPIIQFKKLVADAIIPSRGTPLSAGFDLTSIHDVLIDSSAGVVRVSTGIAVQLPHDCYGRIAMRSGLALRQHLCVTAGVIDLD